MYLYIAAGEDGLISPAGEDGSIIPAGEREVADLGGSTSSVVVSTKSVAESVARILLRK